MFKGIISDLGIIKSIISTSSYTKRVVIETTSSTFLDNVILGSSIACSGICLTVVEITEAKNNVIEKVFAVDLSEETLSITNAKYWTIGYKLNLEKSLLVGDTLDGHFVQGHVDATVNIISILAKGNCYEIEFSFSPKYARYITNKGSVTLNGVSLTVNFISDNIFTVSIIPYTWNNTTFHISRVNDVVNIEVDMIAKYLSRLVNQ